MARKQTPSTEFTQCIVDPQLQLSNALTQGNIDEFRIALDIGADALCLDSFHVCIFEMALRTPGRAAFVAECLRNNCPPNYQNPRLSKAAINYATDSRDPEILKTLLHYKGVNVDHKYAELSPLNSLAKNVTNENYDDVLACIKILLQHGASPNIPDQREMIPLHYITKNKKIDEQKKLELMQLFLDLPNIDIDTYRDGELRTILAAEYPKLPLPAAMSNQREVDIAMMISYIRNCNTKKFQEQFEAYRNSAANSEEEKYTPLLIECLKAGNNKIFDILMEHEINYNAIFEGNNALEIAAIYGNVHALKILLEKPDIHFRAKDHPMITIIRRLNESSFYQSCDYRACFHLLLESDKVDINEMDESRTTALHYAVKYRNNYAAKELLQAGAYIGFKNMFDDLPIDGMQPDLLEQHFDDCITSNKLKMGDDKFEIYMDYKNLIPPGVKRNFRGDEMAPIMFMAESKEYRDLLRHPLITSLLFLKWYKLSLVFYLNFLFYVLFALSLITHTVLKFKDSDHPKVIFAFGICSWVGIAYMIAREFMQFIMSPWHYLCSYTNYVELGLIALSTLTCIEATYDKETQKIIAITAILLIAWELCHLVGSLPVQSISTHMRMLDAVCKSFIKSFSLYSIFVITFSLCFYILFGKAPKGSGENNKDDNDADDEDSKMFSNPFAVVLKTIVMFTGELEASSVKFNTVFSYVFFLIFVLFMTIVLLNLLNGLAVSDTQDIQAQAELNGIICRANLLSRYEEVIAQHSGGSTSILKFKPFHVIMNFFNLHPSHSLGQQICIMPNNGNRFFICAKNTKELKEIQDQAGDVFISLTQEDIEREIVKLEPPEHFIPCLCSCITHKCSQMNSKTVNLAMAVIEKKSRSRNDDISINEILERKMENVEKKLERILDLLLEKEESKEKSQENLCK